MSTVARVFIFAAFIALGWTAFLVACASGGKTEPHSVAPPHRSASVLPNALQAPTATSSSARPNAPSDVWNPCAETLDCARRGWCSYAEGKCIPFSSGDCKWTCFDSGACTFANGRCVAASDDDCANSRACREASFCARDGVECGLRGTADLECRRSEACIRLGLCFARDGFCVARDRYELCRVGRVQEVRRMLRDRPPMRCAPGRLRSVPNLRERGPVHRVRGRVLGFKRGPLPPLRSV